MTCSIDHDAENAIPLFLCAACNRETVTSKENRQTLDTGGGVFAATERVQALEPAVYVR
jgi:hypothetical protein